MNLVLLIKKEYYMATIKVLPKGNKDLTSYENYRPISLMNNDMKLQDYIYFRYIHPDRQLITRVQ